MSNEEREVVGQIGDLAEPEGTATPALDGRVGMAPNGRMAAAVEMWALMADPVTGAIYKGPSIGYHYVTPQADESGNT